MFPRDLVARGLTAQRSAIKAKEEAERKKRKKRRKKEKKEKKKAKKEKKRKEKEARGEDPVRRLSCHVTPGFQGGSPTEGGEESKPKEEPVVERRRTPPPATIVRDVHTWRIRMLIILTGGRQEIQGEGHHAYRYRLFGKALKCYCNSLMNVLKGVLLQIFCLFCCAKDAFPSF